MAAGLDHHAVDAAVQPGLRGRRGHQLRGGRKGRRAVHPGPGPAGRVRAELEDATEVGTLTGAELAGRRYEPLFRYLADAAKFGTQDAFRVILSDDVTTEDGTGVVHMAPAFGEADALACNAAGIPTVLTVDEGARFTAVVPDFEGQHVFDANAGLTARLREQGSLVRQETYTTPTRTAGGAASR